MTVPSDSDPELHSGQIAPRSSSTRENHSVRWNKKETLNWPIRIVGAMVGIALILIIFISVNAHLTKGKVKGERERLTQLVQVRVNTAMRKAEVYDFETAFAVLEKTRTEIADSIIPISGVSDDLYDKITLVQSELHVLHDEYLVKVGNGWSLFEGRFISRDEKCDTLSERQGKAKENQEAKRLLSQSQFLADEYVTALEAEKRLQKRIENELWTRTWNQAQSQAGTLEDVGVLTIAYLEHYPKGEHAVEAKSLQSQAIERLWMNRALDLVDHWTQLYVEIRGNQEFFEGVARRTDAWMYVNELEQLVELNSKYQKKLNEVSAELDSIGAGSFATANMPTENPDAILAFCRANRDRMRYHRWHQDWIREYLPEAKQVQWQQTTVRPESPDESLEWSKAKKAWATAPFLEGTAAMSQFIFLYPDGNRAEEARDHIESGLEMDWSSQVLLNLRIIQRNQMLADEYANLATDHPSQRSSYLEKSVTLLQEANDKIEAIQAMGFVGDPNMKLPNESSNLTEIVLFFREFRFPGKYYEWKKQRLIEIFAAAIN
jgi:hypothetical protein